MGSKAVRGFVIRANPAFPHCRPASAYRPFALGKASGSELGRTPGLLGKLAGWRGNRGVNYP